MDLIKKTYPIEKDYHLGTQILGVGLNGKVYVCIDKVTNIKYALKKFKDKPKARQEIELFLKASKYCDNVVGIKDIFENSVNGCQMLFVVMELIEGGQLFDVISQRTEPFTEKEVANLMYQICNIVKKLHELGIAHRDLKPENLLLTTNDIKNAIIKLIDFGFAKETSKGLKTPCFTPYYVAPEILNHDKYDNSCDIWSLGVIMYILCCGYPPFYSRGGQPISPGMKKRIKLGAFCFPDKEWSMVSNDAKLLIASMLEINPMRRININDILNSKWMTNLTGNPKNNEINNDKELLSVEVLREENNLENAFNNLTTTFREIRVEEEKPFEMKIEKNDLYRRRIHKQV